MRKNPHVRICGGLGSATTLVYPTAWCQHQWAITAARLASTAELSVNDVIEAGAAVDPAVVEAMLVETQASFALDPRTLLQLDDSGVPAEVIDLMVALTFPDEFVVERPPARTAVSFGGGGGGFVDSFSPYVFDLRYPYYASPFGYYYGWSPYNSLYYLGPAVSYVIVPDVWTGAPPAVRIVGAAIRRSGCASRRPTAAPSGGRFLVEPLEQLPSREAEARPARADRATAGRPLPVATLGVGLPDAPPDHETDRAGHYLFKHQI